MFPSRCRSAAGPFGLTLVIIPNESVCHAIAPFPNRLVTQRPQTDIREPRLLSRASLLTRRRDICRKPGVIMVTW